MPDEYDTDYNQWNEDQVDLSFLNVSDLHHLLAARDNQLDYLLFRQSSEIHRQLRKELNSLSTSPSYTEDYLSSNTHSFNDFSSSSQAFESLSSYTPSEKPSQALLINIFKNSSLFSSSKSLHMSSSFAKDADKNNSIPKDDTLPTDYFLTSGNFQVYLFFSILLVLLLLFFLLVIVILFRCKTICQKRYQEKHFSHPPSYMQPSYSLEDLSTRHTCACVVEMGDENRTANHQVAAPRSSSYSTGPSPTSSNIVSFSTFLPPDQERTSPEGSSGGEAARDREDIPRGVCLGQVRRGSVQENEKEENKTIPWSSNDMDEGIESDEDIIHLSTFKPMILARVGEKERLDKEEDGCIMNKERIYAKINYDSKRQGRRNVLENSLKHSNTKLSEEKNLYCSSSPSSNVPECLI